MPNRTKFKRPDENDDKTYVSSYKSRSSRSNWRRRSPASQDRGRRERDNSSADSRRRDRVNSSDHGRKNRDDQSLRNWSSRKDDRKIQSTTIIYTSEDQDSEAPKKIQEPSSSEILSDKEMNDLGAKIVKAEILGNTSKVKELKEKLERARELKQIVPTNVSNNEESVLLFTTDSKGFSRPLNAPQSSDDKYTKKKRKMETHNDGKRLKYYPDDDKYDLKRMFEQEKFNSTAQQDAEFVKLTAKVKKMEDLDDIFMDKIRNEKPDDCEKKAEKEKSRAIAEHQKMTKSLDNCQQCLQSDAMLKHLMISLGETVYLSVPSYEPLTEGHCLIIPIRHVVCSTQLDENEWDEVSDIRKSLTKMFLSQEQDVIFYETVLNVNSYAHMLIHCVPVAKEHGYLAPIYFKKAIEECELEWSTNKKLVNLAGKDVRRAVPKGLPYFFVSFGMNEGFAHVIEDQRYFSQFFAPEVIGGILDLHHSKWRKQANQKFELQKTRVLTFSKNWGAFDCTVK